MARHIMSSGSNHNLKCGLSSLDLCDVFEFDAAALSSYHLPLETFVLYSDIFTLSA